MAESGRFSLKHNELEARERLRAFWAGSSLGRPALIAKAPNPDPHWSPWAGPELDIKAKDLSPEWHAFEAKHTLEKFLFCAESMPKISTNDGSIVTLLAELAGGDYEYTDAGAWVKPLPHLWNQPLPCFDESHPHVQILTKIIYRVAEVVGDRGYINPPHLVDALTTLSNLRTPKQLCMDLIDIPEKVRMWSDALTSIFINAYEYFYQMVTKLGYGDTCSWLDAMAEGRMQNVECDFAVMLSPDMFKEFVLPDLRRQTEYFDYSLYHLDGACQMRFFDLLKTLPKLNGFQWNPLESDGSPVLWLDAFREIRRHKFSLYISCSNIDEAVHITKEIGTDGLLISLPLFQSEAEAEDAIHEIEKVC